jgi:uncharacterized protein
VFPGIGTLVNASTVLVGAALGVAVGHRLQARTRDLVTDALGLVTLLIAASSATAVADPALVAAVGSSAPVLIVLGSLVLGGLVGSALRVEDRLESFGGWLRATLGRRADRSDQTTGDAADSLDDRERFIEGFVTASLLFCVGSLTVVGSIQDGLTGDYETLATKAVLDGFASIALAAALGWGVGLAAITVLVVQGSITLAAGLFEDILVGEALAALTSAGGVTIIGIALKLLDLKDVKVGNFLPALIVAPALVGLVSLF